ncbi:MAG: ATPase, T2SS/T4P/T4SS family [Acidobacteriota bacterium]|jgi:type IV pilus assembly protein PilB
MGELLLREGLLKPEELEIALKEQERGGGRLGYHLIRLGYLNVSQLSQFLKDSMGLIPYNLTEWIRDPSVMDRIPVNLAQFYQVIPVEQNGDVLTVAIADLDNPRLIPALEELTGMTIDPVVCPREVVIRALEQFYGPAKDPGVVRSEAGDHLFVLSKSLDHIRPLHWSTLKPDSSATDWLRTILAEAIRIGCRTVVVRPQADAIRVAFQVGGKLEDRFQLHIRKLSELDSLIAQLARLKDNRRGARHEGRVRLQVESRFLTLHVNVLQTLSGRRYSFTLYDEKVFHAEWEDLAKGLTPEERQSLETALSSPRGMILMVGAAGGGMTGAFYALLAHARKYHSQVIALEDFALAPVNGVSQVEIGRLEGSSWPEQITLAFKQGPGLTALFPLKERRSMELALLGAVQGAVVGVFHQQSAAGAVRWLLRNQFRSPIKAGVLQGILTVVSLPRLCPNCRLPLEVREPDGRPAPMFTRQGCEHCLTWDTPPMESMIEWIATPQGALPIEESEASESAFGRLIETAGGVPLVRRVVRLGREGVLDGAGVRDFLASRFS